MLLLSQESKAYCFVGVRGVSKAGVALQCAALCVTVVNNLGVICNGILVSKEYPLGFSLFFRPKLFFLKSHESPNAAAIIPLRDGSKAIGNTRSFILLPSFKKAQNSSLTLPTSSLWLGHGATLFSRTRVLSHCAIWLPSPRRRWKSSLHNLLVLWWAEGAISLSVLRTVAGCSGVPWLMERKPQIL